MPRCSLAAKSGLEKDSRCLFVTAPSDAPFEGLIVTMRGGRIAGIRFGRGGAPLSAGAASETDVAAPLAEYLAGEKDTLSDLPLSLPKTSSFCAQVWSSLQRIPSGETQSYGDIAKALGKAGAARAVGRANASNPVPLVVPCHRVVRSDGSLGGYAFGLAIKEWLLAHEAKHFARAKG